MGRNRNKAGTCKCVDYYQDDNGSYWVKQVRKKSGKIFELKCNRKVIDGSDFCEMHQNCPDFLKKCIDSFFFQDDKNFELIIADDGSTKETKKIIDDNKNLSIKILA